MCASVARVYCWFTKNAIEKRKKINNNVYFCAFFRVDIFYKIERSFGAQTLNVLDSHAPSLLLLLFQLIHGLSFIHTYTLCLPMLAIQTQAHKSLALYIFFASVRAKRRYYLLLFFRCTPFLMPFYYIHICTDYTRRDTSTFEICMDFCCCFIFSSVLLFVFRFCFHLFIWFDSTSLHWLFVLLNIEHNFAIVYRIPANAPIRLNLI